MQLIINQLYNTGGDGPFRLTSIFINANGHVCLRMVWQDEVFDYDTVTDASAIAEWTQV